VDVSAIRDQIVAAQAQYFAAIEYQQTVGLKAAPGQFKYVKPSPHDT